MNKLAPSGPANQDAVSEPTGNADRFTRATPFNACRLFCGHQQIRVQKKRGSCCWVHWVDWFRSPVRADDGASRRTRGFRTGNMQASANTGFTNKGEDTDHGRFSDTQPSPFSGEAAVRGKVRDLTGAAGVTGWCSRFKTRHNP